MQEKIDNLGFKISWGTWSPSPSKVKALLDIKVTNLKTLRSFLGALNFYRRHIPSFTDSSAILTDLTKKDVIWTSTKAHEEKFQELKKKLANLNELGVPRPHGEIILASDGSDVGGGSTIFQWQALEKGQIPEKFQTIGVQKDGNLKHTYPDTFRLVPL